MNSEFDCVKNGIEVMTINRLGETNTNKYGTVMKIIEYNKSSDIVVEFKMDIRQKYIQHIQILQEVK